MHAASKLLLLFYKFMAKKTKPKKSGMLKRRQQKRQKKMLRRRLAMPKRVPQQPASTEQLEQLLSTLPTLAFECGGGGGLFLVFQQY